MLFHVPECVCLLHWLSIASGMQIVFVYVPLCVHSLPMPGASQTWGVKRSLRMGFSNTGSSGKACFKAEAGRNSFRTCVHSMRLCAHMHVCGVPFSWINPLQVQKYWFISASQGGTITKNHEGTSILRWVLILQSECQARQPYNTIWVGVMKVDMGTKTTSAIDNVSNDSESLVFMKMYS